MDVFDFHRRNESRVDPAIEDLAHRVIGAAIEVHEELGPGLPESVYREAIHHELGLRGIECVREFPVPIYYKGKLVGEGRLDLLVCGKLIIELKAVESLSAVHRDQCISYLKATKLPLALLINFNVQYLKDGIKRVINTV
ncbi:MAG TPA: GxxExxY protein [Tepidisphaeraceae bacterium]|jgi:GxxExxY protein|nr:GxxExxY protein [Tepidisphaeraceae bacterium]